MNIRNRIMERGVKMQKFTIDGRLPTLNEYINKCRYNKFAGNSFKKKYQEYIESCILFYKIKPMKKVNIIYKFYEKNKRRDKDNVSSFARKVINDALQEVQILSNDNWQCIGILTDEFYIDKENFRIEVELYECE